MTLVSPSTNDTDNAALGRRLWDVAGQSVAAPYFAGTEFNGGRPQRLLGLIFPRFAEFRFIAQRDKLEKVSASARRGSRLKQIDVPSPKIQNLRRTGDLLLPRLLSVQVELKTAEASV